MKIYTQADVDRQPRTENSAKVFPKAQFAAGIRFPENCRFAAGCTIGAHCTFGEACTFYTKCVFGAGCTFAAGCTFGARCTFGAHCTFGQTGSFGEGCDIGAWSCFGEACTFYTKCVFGAGCTFAENGEFDAACGFEGGIARTGFPYIAIDGAGSNRRKTYFFNLETGIRVRSGCFTGTLAQFRAKVIKDCPEGNEVKRLQYLGMANIAAVTFGGEVEY